MAWFSVTSLGQSDASNAIPFDLPAEKRADHVEPHAIFDRDMKWKGGKALVPAESSRDITMTVIDLDKDEDVIAAVADVLQRPRTYSPTLRSWRAAREEKKRARGGSISECESVMELIDEQVHVRLEDDGDGFFDGICVSKVFAVGDEADEDAARTDDEETDTQEACFYDVRDVCHLPGSTLL